MDAVDATESASGGGEGVEGVSLGHASDQRGVDRHARSVVGRRYIDAGVRRRVKRGSWLALRE